MDLALRQLARADADPARCGVARCRVEGHRWGAWLDSGGRVCSTCGVVLNQRALCVAGVHAWGPLTPWVDRQGRAGVSKRACWACALWEVSPSRAS